jgi:hypothetical protein
MESPTPSPSPNGEDDKSPASKIKVYACECDHDVVAVLELTVEEAAEVRRKQADLRTIQTTIDLADSVDFAKPPGLFFWRPACDGAQAIFEAIDAVTGDAALDADMDRWFAIEVPRSALSGERFRTAWEYLQVSRDSVRIRFLGKNDGLPLETAPITDAMLEAAVGEVKDNQAPMTSAEYVEAGGSHCPFCRGADLDASPVDADGPDAYGAVDCMSCGKAWVDHYRLADFDPDDDSD